MKKTIIIFFIYFPIFCYGVDKIVVLRSFNIHPFVSCRFCEVIDFLLEDFNHSKYIHVCFEKINDSNIFWGGIEGDNDSDYVDEYIAAKSSIALLYENKIILLSICSEKMTFLLSWMPLVTIKTKPIEMPIKKDKEEAYVFVSSSKISYYSFSFSRFYKSIIIPHEWFLFVNMLYTQIF